MKRYASIMGLLLCLAAFAGAKEAEQFFSVKWYGSFRTIIQERELGGAVALEKALSGPHIYAVGMLKDAAGEITVADGAVSVNYGKDGIKNAVSTVRKGEEASLLITSNIAKWRTIRVPENMSEGELRAFVLEEARKTGINTREPFPFLVEGTVRKLVWSVLDGTDAELTKQTGQTFFRKLIGYRTEASAVLVGFYPAGAKGDLAWPGEAWHVHVLFTNENTTGHVNAFSVEKGATLSLPAKE